MGGGVSILVRVEVSVADDTSFCLKIDGQADPKTGKLICITFVSLGNLTEIAGHQNHSLLSSS